jgi:hypothetical protein
MIIVTPETPERPGVLVENIPVDEVPLLFLACGAQDLFVTDNRRFVEKLTARTRPHSPSFCAKPLSAANAV